MTQRADDAALDLIFREARTYNAWRNLDAPEALIREAYNLAKMGPTSANCSPARFVWIRTEEAKARYLPCLSEGNRAKAAQAPWNVIIAYDLKFYDKIPQLFPHNPGAREWFAGDEKVAFDTAYRNSALQGAYLMLAARALGLDCGPMSGFDYDRMNQEFFAGTDWRAHWVCSIGYGSEENLFPRSPRLDFDEACQVL